MDRSNRKYILIMFLLSIFILTGCSNNTSDEKNVKEITEAPKDTDNSADQSSDIESSEDISQEAGAATPTTAEQPMAETELQIYTINENGELEPVFTMISQEDEKTPQLVVDKVVEAFADQDINIGIDKVEPKDDEKDAIIVSFMKDSAPSVQMGSEYEANILNAFAQSLLDNLENYNKVIFQMEGKEYISGAYEFLIDQPYMQR